MCGCRGEWWVWVPRVALGVAGGSEGPKKSDACTSGSSPHNASNDDHRLLSSCHTPTRTTMSTWTSLRPLVVPQSQLPPTFNLFHTELSPAAFSVNIDVLSVVVVPGGIACSTRWHGRVDCPADTPDPAGAGPRPHTAPCTPAATHGIMRLMTRRVSTTSRRLHLLPCLSVTLVETALPLL
jgi:hypothetical protein